LFFLLVLLAGIAAWSPAALANGSDARPKRLLYVACPGIRDYLDYGGHGVLVFDIDQGHTCIRRIAFAGLNEQGQPQNVKGICGSAATGRLYLTALNHLIAIDLSNDRVLWERTYDAGCDRLAISPDGKTLYLPSLEKDHWCIVDAESGEVTAKVVTNSGSHNTICGGDGRLVYLAGLKSPLLSVADTQKHVVVRTIGPFGNMIRPFVINGRQTLCFVNVNELLGFEIGDLQTGKVLHRIEVQGFKKGPTKRHGCPSHGIGLTPDEKELWLTDAFNSRLHLFDATVMPPKQIASIALRDQPGWITFSIDGRFAYPSSGDVIDTQTRRIVARLQDETGREVQSEKLLEIDFRGNQPIRVGNQFGVGQVTEVAAPQK
jgi:DNA-binding beta-propeller fold protein YncE